MTRDVGFAMRGLVHIRLPLQTRAANDDACPVITVDEFRDKYRDMLSGKYDTTGREPPPVRPPPKVRPLDDLSVRRAEREFLRS